MVWTALQGFRGLDFRGSFQMDIGVNNSKDKINITLSQSFRGFGFPAFTPFWFSKDQDSGFFRTSDFSFALLTL